MSEDEVMDDPMVDLDGDVDFDDDDLDIDLEESDFLDDESGDGFGSEEL